VCFCLGQLVGASNAHVGMEETKTLKDAQTFSILVILAGERER
jgi:hypothetical protein